MKKLKLDEAIGKKLFHDMTSIFPDGSKGARFKRGHILCAEDLEVLRDMGKEYVYVDELEVDQVHEEEAIRLVLERAIDNESVYLTSAREGKVDVCAKFNGLLQIDVGALRKLNTVKDYTVVTDHNSIAVKQDAVVASGRIVPLFTQEVVVDEAVKIVDSSECLVKVLPFNCLKVGILITGNEVFYGRIEDKFESILREKLTFYNAEIVDVRKSRDSVDEILSNADKLLQLGAEIILFTGGMSVDPDDVTPTAIKKFSDKFIFQGVPMQPGNMLTLAYKDKTALVGVPAASMHSKFTSLDIMLPHLFTNKEVSKALFLNSACGALYLGKELCRY